MGILHHFFAGQEEVGSDSGGLCGLGLSWGRRREEWGGGGPWASATCLSVHLLSTNTHPGGEDVPG